MGFFVLLLFLCFINYFYIFFGFIECFLSLFVVLVFLEGRFEIGKFYLVYLNLVGRCGKVQLQYLCQVDFTLLDL